MIASAAKSSMPAPLKVLSPLDYSLAQMRIARITVDNYNRMIAAGVLPEDATIELLRGAIVHKDRSSPGGDPMGHGPLHRQAVALLIRLAAKIDGAGQHLQVQLPVECPPYGAPEPDGSIIRGQARDYKDHNPSAGHCSCVIEAADSSLQRDQTDKLMTYAAAGIPQYVIVDLENSAVEVYSDPDPNAESYQTKSTCHGEQTLSLRLPAGTVEVTVAELLPER